MFILTFEHACKLLGILDGHIWKKKSEASIEKTKKFISLLTQHPSSQFQQFHAFRRCLQAMDRLKVFPSLFMINIKIVNRITWVTLQFTSRRKEKFSDQINFIINFYLYLPDTSQSWL